MAYCSAAPGSATELYADGTTRREHVDAIAGNNLNDPQPTATETEQQRTSQIESPLVSDPIDSMVLDAVTISRKSDTAMGLDSARSGACPITAGHTRRRFREADWAL